MTLPSPWRSRLGDVPPLDPARLDNLTQPRGSLGQLESLVVQVAGITGQVVPRVAKPLTVIFAADRGVAEDGVSAYGVGANDIWQ